MRKIKKSLSLFLAFVLALLPMSAAFAMEAPQENINVVIKKLMYEGEESLNDIITNDGTEKAELDKRLSAYDASKYGKVAFSAYKITVLSKIPSDKNAQQVANEVEAAVKAGKELPYGATLVQKDVEVDASGNAMFNNIENNKNYGYVFVETVSSDLVKQIASPIFVRLPMMNPENSGYIKDNVFLYPKNKVGSIDLEFIRLQHRSNEDAAKVLEGAQFKLYFGEVGKGVAVKESAESDKDLILTSNAEGKITIPGLVKGKYYLVEQGVNSLVDTMLANGNEGRLAVRGNAQNDEHNKLYFEVGEDGKITTSDEFVNYTNYEKPSLKKELVQTNAYNSYNIYENINYKLTVDVPKNTKEYSKLYVEDKLLKGTEPTTDIRYVADSFKVMAGQVELKEGVDFTLTKTENTFKMDFIVNGAVTDNIKNANQIIVTYDAEFVPGVEPSTNYVNGASITYNNSPNGNNEDRTEDVPGVEVKTYGFLVKKTDDGLWKSSVAAKGLDGAKFILLDSEGNVFKGFDEKKEAIFGKDGEDNFVLESADGGMIKLVGLKSGKYTLREIQAPTGFITPFGKDADTEITVNEESHLEAKTVTIQNDRAELVMTGRESAVLTILALCVAGVAVTGVYLSKTEKKKEIKK